MLARAVAVLHNSQLLLPRRVKYPFSGRVKRPSPYVLAAIRQESPPSLSPLCVLLPP